MKMYRPLLFLGPSLLITLCFCAQQRAQAEVRLSGIFSDHMVLQREQPLPIWGWTEEQQSVTVHFADQTLSVTASGDGFWEAHPTRQEVEVADHSLRLVGWGSSVSL
jgi:sialate O-acetylesterase